MRRRTLGSTIVAVISIVAATILWAAFVSSPAVVRSVSAPIEFRNMPRGFEISSAVPGTVYLELAGPAARLHTLDLSGVIVRLDLASVTSPGERTFTIQAGNVDVQPGVEVVRAVPAQIRLRFERKMTAQVPVQVRFGSAPPVGYHIVSQNVWPATVTIAGPESHVRDVDHAETDPIDLSQALEKQNFRVQTFVRDAYVRLQSSPAVTVSITLGKD